MVTEEELLFRFNSFILMKNDNARRLLQNKRGERKGDVLGPVSNGQTKELKAYGGSNSPKMPGDLERNGIVSKSYRKRREYRNNLDICKVR